MGQAASDPGTFMVTLMKLLFFLGSRFAEREFHLVPSELCSFKVGRSPTNMGEGGS